MSSLPSWFLAARPRTLPAAFAPVLLGSAYAAHLGYFQPAPAALCAAFALLAQIGANFANDYFDFRRGADAPGRLGPTRAVASGLISPAAMLRATFLALGLAACAGLGLVHYGGGALIVVGGASLLAALAYTGGPFPLAYHGLGEVCALVFFGFVAVLGTYYVQSQGRLALGWVNGPFPPGLWLIAAACGLLAANILLVNNIRDLATDARAGKRTLVVRWGRRFGHGLYTLHVLFALGVAALLCLASFHWSLLLGIILTLLTALVIAPLGLILARRLASTPASDGPRFNRLLAQSAQFLALWAMVFSLGLAFG